MQTAPKSEILPWGSGAFFPHSMHVLPRRRWGQHPRPADINVRGRVWQLKNRCPTTSLASRHHWPHDIIGHENSTSVHRRPLKIPMQMPSPRHGHHRATAGQNIIITTHHRHVSYLGTYTVGILQTTIPTSPSPITKLLFCTLLTNCNMRRSAPNSWVSDTWRPDTWQSCRWPSHVRHALKT